MKRDHVATSARLLHQVFKDHLEQLVLRVHWVQRARQAPKDLEGSVV